MQLHYITEQVLIGSIRRWANGGLGGNYRNKVGRGPAFLYKGGGHRAPRPHHAAY